MLESLFNREGAIQENIERCFEKGRQFIEGKMFNQAMMEYTKALELDNEKVYPRLLGELDNFSTSGNFEGSLAVGLNLLKDNNQDYELANQLGNYARQSGDYKQSKSLYKHALKIKKKFKWGVFNLAAAMAKVDVYDDQAVSAVQKFDNVKDFILPEYIGGEKLIDEISEKLLEKKKIAINDKVQKKTLEKESKSSEDANEALRLDKEIEELKKKAKQSINKEDIFQYFEKMAETDPENIKNHLYNQGLYALSIHDPQKASQCFQNLFKILDEHQKEFAYLDFCCILVLAQQGNLDQAIDDLNKLRGKNRYNRYYNVNLGLLYRKKGSCLLAYKYLIQTNRLLESSEGIYNASEMLRLADEKFAEGEYKKALKFYQVVASESGKADIWGKIGEVYLRQNQYEQAASVYQKILQIDPDTKVAKVKLHEIYDFFVTKAKTLRDDLKMKPAADNLEKALKIFRDPDTIKLTAKVYEKLKNLEREKELMEEWHKIKEQEKKQKVENERQNHLTAANKFLKTKNFRLAIEHFENAFRMKLDKEVFVRLAQIYKGLKKVAELQDLANRFNKMMEYEEKLRKYQKMQERTNTASD